MPRFKYILFDFDGTLVDSKEAFITAFNQLAQQYNFKPMLVEELEYLRTLTIQERARHLHFPLYKLPFLTLRLYKLYKNHLPQLRLFEGIKEVLSLLEKKGHRLVIVSSNSVPTIKSFLLAQGVTQIAEVLCSNKIFGKDRMINRFLKAHDLSTDEVLYVGDELRDVLACQKSNIPIAWVSWGFDAWEAVQPAGPTFVIHSPNELLPLV